MITSFELVFLARQNPYFAPFGAGIRIHRTNHKNGAACVCKKLYSPTFLPRPSATFSQKVAEAITFMKKVIPLTLFVVKVTFSYYVKKVSLTKV